MSGLRTTRTYATLEVSPAAFEEIRRKLREAGYDHAFHDDLIDMDGIAVREAEPAKEPTAFELRMDGMEAYRR